MAEFDVETLSLKELKSLQKDLAKAISTFEDRQKSDARSKLEIAEMDREKFFGRPTTPAERAAREDRGSNQDVIERIGELANDLPQARPSGALTRAAGCARARRHARRRLCRAERQHGLRQCRAGARHKPQQRLLPRHAARARAHGH